MSDYESSETWRKVMWLQVCMLIGCMTIRGECIKVSVFSC